VDEAALRRLVEFQVDQGITGIVPCGTTGESPTLAKLEHLRTIEVAIEAADGRVAALAGTGSNRTASAIETSSAARNLGAAGLLLVDCYYNGPSSLELRRHYYEPILEAVPEIPIMPYVIPGRSGCALGAADLAILHQQDPARVPAVKQATGDLDRMRLDRDLAGPSLAILSGDDEITLNMMRDPAIGCAGVVSVMANIAPATVAGVVAAQASGDEATADRLAASLAPLLRLVGCQASATRTLPNGRSVQVTDAYRNPVPLKTMMAGLGMLGGRLRAPLGPMSSDAVAQVRQALLEVHAKDPTVLSPIEAGFDVNLQTRLADDAIWSALVS
jgi:4-hydroxy-tetrahydrodipicolinate synthase